MRYINNLMLESKKLEVFEVERLLTGFLEDKGIKANVQKFEEFFNIYISSYAGDEENKKRIPVKKILDYFKTLDLCDDAQISKTKFGYTIQMIDEDNGDSAKLMEAIESEEDEGHTCTICENIYHGLGNDPWPVYTSPEDRVCNECNKEYVIPARLELLNEKTQTEAIDKGSVEHAASNVVLDSKYIWLFNVLDKNGEDIKEGIEYLQDAIEILVSQDGTFLVGFPYIDPKPEDESVELVFADNPGPIVIYNREEATVSKDKLQRPSKETKAKDKLESVSEAYSKRDLTSDVITIADAAYAAYEADVIDREEYRGVEDSRDTLLDYLENNVKESVKTEAQALSEKQIAVKGINDAYNYLKKYSEALPNFNKLAKYARLILKGINTIDSFDDKIKNKKNESIEDYGIRCTEDDAWTLYNEASDHFPEEPEQFTDQEVDTMKKAMIEYIMKAYTEEQIESILEDKTYLHQVAEEIFEVGEAALAIEGDEQ